MLLYMPGLAYKRRKRTKLADCEVAVGGALTYLSAALDDIEGANEGVRDTAGEDTSDHALAVVRHIVDVTHLSGGLRLI